MTASSSITVASLFEESFGRRPEAIASAPGRVNLIGEHTDYNGGEVLPIAIAHRTFVAIGRASGSVSRAVSATESGHGQFDLHRAAPSGGWWDYVVGTALEAARDLPPLPSALHVAVTSEVPAGAGLSSSAALEVATAFALYGTHGIDPDAEVVARLAHRAENGFVGVASGIMDQYASALARESHALHLWCDTATFEQVPFRETVLIFDTAVPRSLRGSAFNERRAECDAALRLLRELDPELPHLAAASLDLVAEASLPEPLGRRARHVAAETRRVRTAVEALASGAALPGDLLLASHASLRDDYECSSPELDWFVDHVMNEAGVTGARLTGAGWGGCAIAIGARDALDAVAERVAAEYAAHFSLSPRVWITGAEAGAALLRRG